MTAPRAGAESAVQSSWTPLRRERFLEQLLTLVARFPKREQLELPTLRRELMGQERAADGLAASWLLDRHGRRRQLASLSQRGQLWPRRCCDPGWVLQDWIQRYPVREETLLAELPRFQASLRQELLSPDVRATEADRKELRVIGQVLGSLKRIIAREPLRALVRALEEQLPLALPSVHLARRKLLQELTGALLPSLRNAGLVSPEQLSAFQESLGTLPENSPEAEPAGGRSNSRATPSWLALAREALQWGESLPRLRGWRNFYILCRLLPLEGRELLQQMEPPDPVDLKARALREIPAEALLGAAWLAPSWAPLAQARLSWPGLGRLAHWFQRYGTLAGWLDFQGRPEQFQELEWVSQHLQALSPNQLDDLQGSLAHYLADGPFILATFRGETAPGVREQLTRKAARHRAVLALGLLPPEAMPGSERWSLLDGYQERNRPRAAIRQKQVVSLATLLLRQFFPRSPEASWVALQLELAQQLGASSGASS